MSPDFSRRDFVKSAAALAAAPAILNAQGSVSYTHLTLPTSDLV